MVRTLRPSRDEGGYDVPWPAADTSWLVEEFWPRLERLAGDPEHELGAEVAHRLRMILEGKPPLPFDSVAPPLRLVCRDGKLSWGIATAEGPLAFEREVRFTLMLLWHPAVRGRLGSCRQCARFFLRAPGRGRKRRFCSDGHRKSFHVEAAAPMRAAYQRAWRNPHLASTATK